jgi:hypothetical protein
MGLVGKPKEKVYLKELYADGRIILNSIFHIIVPVHSDNKSQI